MTDPIEVARRHDDAFNARDVDSRKAIEAPDVEVFMPGGVVLRGPEQAIAAVKSFWDAIPDVRLEAESWVSDGETVATQGRLVGTHNGTFRAPNLEIPPTGRSVNFRYAAVKQIKDDRIVSEHLYFDRLELMQQLGALPG